MEWFLTKLFLELQFACYYVANCSQHLDVWLEAEQEPKLNFTTPFGDQLNCTVEVIGGEPSDKELYCLDTVCPPDAFGLPETASSIPEFVQISSNQPIASQGSMIFFFWDVLWIVFGMLVWYRLQSLKDVSTFQLRYKLIFYSDEPDKCSDCNRRKRYRDDLATVSACYSYDAVLLDRCGVLLALDLHAQSRTAARRTCFVFHRLRQKLFIRKV